MLINDGIISNEELQPILPPTARMKKGPVAIIECLQDIPCDPCVAACPVKAITMKEGITDRPKIAHEKCTGCGICIASCPGLAIFVVDMNYTDKTALLSLPHELLPVPVKDEIVKALDRSGKHVCDAKVIRTLSSKKFDRTTVITIEIPKELAMDVRAVRAPLKGKSA